MFQMVRKDFVILLKAAPEDSEPDAYQAHLTGLGFAVELVPVIVFTFVNSEELRQRLAESEQYGALVLTSKRAVDAVKLSADGGCWWQRGEVWRGGGTSACMWWGREPRPGPARSWASTRRWCGARRRARRTPSPGS